MIDSGKIVNEIKKRLANRGFKGVVIRHLKEDRNTYYLDRSISGKNHRNLADYCSMTKDLCVYSPDSRTAYTPVKSKIYNLSDPEFFEKCIDKIIEYYS